MMVKKITFCVAATLFASATAGAILMRSASVKTDAEEEESHDGIMRVHEWKAQRPLKSFRAVDGSDKLFFEPFDTEDAMSRFTIIDANNDDRTWDYQNNFTGCASVMFRQEHAMDDWMITPALPLEKGKVYKFQFDVAAWSGDTYPERIEVKMGRNARVDAMTTQVVPPTVITNVAKFDGFRTITEYIMVPETADWYIGFHGCSDKASMILLVDNIAVNKAVSGSVPKEITALEIEPGMDGELTADISFRAPSRDFNNTRLEMLTKIEVKRDGELVKTIENPEPGSFINYTDQVSAEGEYKYEITPFNTAGEGRPVEKSVYIGIDYPAPVSNVRIAETAVPGEVKVSWDAPANDVNGNPISASKVKYIVADAMRSGNTKLVEGLEQTEYTFTADLKNQKQTFVCTWVVPVTNRGEGEATRSDMIPVGKAYLLPLEESFAGGTTTIFGTTNVAGGNSRWNILSDYLSPEVKSYDSDGGLLVCEASNANDITMFYSGKIDFSTAKAPHINFYLYNEAQGENVEKGNLDIVEVLAKPADATEWSVVASGTVDQLCQQHRNQWSRVSSPLDMLKGKVAQIGIRYTVRNTGTLYFDALSVFDLLDYNLALTTVSAPAKVKANKEFNVTVDVSNKGSRKAEGYKVVVKRDGKTIESIDGIELEPDESISYDVTTSLPTAIAKAEYTAAIEYESDQNKADNEFGPVQVRNTMPRLPNPTGLTVSDAGQGAWSLEWKAPDMASMGDTYTEDFEDFEPFNLKGTEDWQFVDVDGKPSGGFQGMDIPNVSKGQTPTSFLTFDSSYGMFGSENYKELFKSHSGSMYLAALMVYDDSSADDWAISPALSGRAHTVSLWARSIDDEYKETIEFYYSTKGTAITDFVKAGEAVAIPTEWKEYSFNVPEGAKYFAIRHIGTPVFMLMVDDITYEPEGAGQTLTVTGYNVYRDSERVNATPLATPAFKDSEAPAGNHIYCVTALLSNGTETAPSEFVSTDKSGVSSIISNGVNIRCAHGEIIVAADSATEVSIWTIDGVLIHAGRGAAEVAVAPGVYVVRVGGKAVKVVVK